MSEIKREYNKEYRLSAIFVLAWSVLMCFCAFNPFRTTEPSVVVCVIFGVVALYAITLTIITISAPMVFKNKLKKMPEKEQDEILNGKFTRVGQRRFYENFLLYYVNRTIQIVKFDDIESIEPKGHRIKIRLRNGKKSTIFVTNGENSAMLAAAIKSKNYDISVIIGGKAIDKQISCE